MYDNTVYDYYSNWLAFLTSYEQYYLSPEVYVEEAGEALVPIGETLVSYPETRVTIGGIPNTA